MQSPSSTTITTFLKRQSAGGILLMLAAVLALFSANSFLAEYYELLQLREQVAELVKHPDQPGLVEIVEGLFEKYSWAVKPLATLFSAVCLGI